MKAAVDILYEDEGLVVVNKPSGLLCEGGGDREIDLEQIVSEIASRDVRCCHRIDRLTSGVVLMRKGKRYTKELAPILEGGKIRKEYRVLVDGLWDKSIQKVETLIAPQGNGRWGNVAEGGKPAVSTFRLLASDLELGVSLLSVLLKTGRTHQIRLHASRVGCPVLGDPLYGKNGDKFGLHAWSLQLKHPISGQLLRCEAPMPSSWFPILSSLGVC